jgi:tripartite ATP-independent transporter DctM subunit
VDWYFVLLILIAVLFILLLSGMPVAFAFMALNFIAIYFLMGGVESFTLVVHSAFNMLNNFMMAPIPLFIIMGEILFQSGAAWRVIDSLDKWIGRMPARLSFLSVAAGTVFAVVSGVPMGTTAMLGAVFVPEMRKRGYSNMMSIGPVLGGGSLALIIPPSAMAVILGGLAEVSIGHLLIASIVPGLLLSGLYIVYILYQAMIHPEQVPKYTSERIPFKEKVTSLYYIIPLAGVIFLVTGVIFLGVATPTEAAATGALASFVLVVMYRSFSWSALNKSILGSAQVTIMVMLIITGSVAFCQLMAYTGCTHALARFASTLEIHPFLIVISMQLVVLILGCFMDLISLTMITIPIFMPVVNALGLDPVWFCTMMLINLGAATLTPPFGMLLFTMKGVAPADVSMGDIIRAAIPYFLMNLVIIGLILIFPSIALWLPSQMK